MFLFQNVWKFQIGTCITKKLESRISSFDSLIELSLMYFFVEKRHNWYTNGTRTLDVIAALMKEEKSEKTTTYNKSRTIAIVKCVYNIKFWSKNI